MSLELSSELYEKIKYFIPRLLLPGLGWGDLVVATQSMNTSFSDETSFWKNWLASWTEQAEKYEKAGEKAGHGNYHVTAYDNYMNAATCYHWAEFMYFHEPHLKEKVRKKVTGCFEEALTFAFSHCQKVSIPFQGLHLPGYFLSPDEKNDLPCVILINGLDSAKEVELFTFAKQFMARGLSVLIFDGPGQGVMLGHYAMPIYFELVLQACVDYLISCHRIQKDKIGLFGVSFGGYLALRGASRLGKQIKACINLSGGFDIDHFDEINLRIKHDFAYVFQQEKLDDMSILAKQKLHLKELPAPTCPVLCIHGGFDTIFTLASCQRIMNWCQGRALLKFYPNEKHVCQNYFHEYIPLMCDWMRDCLK